MQSHQMGFLIFSQCCVELKRMFGGFINTFGGHGLFRITDHRCIKGIILIDAEAMDSVRRTCDDVLANMCLEVSCIVHACRVFIRVPGMAHKIQFRDSVK